MSIKAQPIALNESSIRKRCAICERIDAINALVKSSLLRMYISDVVLHILGNGHLRVGKSF